MTRNEAATALRLMESLRQHAHVTEINCARRREYRDATAMRQIQNATDGLHEYLKAAVKEHEPEE